MILLIATVVTVTGVTISGYNDMKLRELRLIRENL